ncbi:MAG: LysR family transcriptional regulator [Desulfovibrio sp.]|jgi:molybdate transport system regulatory protein|nr:LysR family transcriptional regulator [Desulfovibrio sp.]
MDEHEETAVVRLHLWMERGGETLFGLGRLQLLERIDTCGSIKGAADQLGMSYRAAWGKLRASEEALGLALVEKVGGNKSGCRLTPEGQRLAGAFRHWFAAVERHAISQANQLFPFFCGGFDDRGNLTSALSANSCATQNIAK